MSHAASYRRLLEEIQGARQSALDTWARNPPSHAAGHAAARPSWQRMASAWERLRALLPPALPHKDPSGAGAWLDFCEQDVPAFRAGYLKVQAYRSLRRTPLDAAQRARVLALALHHAEAPQHRRELGALGDLAAALADPAYVEALARLLAQAPEDRDRWKVGVLLLKALVRQPQLQPHSPFAAEALARDLDALRRAHWARLHRAWS